MTKFLSLFMVLTSFECATAQTYNDPNAVAIPSVNNKFFVSNSNVDVNLYSGTPDISVPIYTLNSKVFNVPVSLSYVSARGIKVQDVANYVGLGWRLNGSGAITRLLRGLPDEYPHGYVGTSPSGSAVTTAATNSNNSTTLGQIGTGQIDGEPDIFSVSTPYFSFQFQFDQNGKPVFPNNSGYSISTSFVNTGNYLSTWFIVTDDHGNQYYFGSSSASRENATVKLFNTSYIFTDTWYLDKVVAFNNAEQIVFNYVAGSDYTINHYLSNTVINTYVNVNTSPGVPIGGITVSNWASVTYPTTYNAPKYLSSIVTSMGEVDFNYLFDRRDVINAGRLTSVAIYPYNPVTLAKGSALKTYSFNYTYFGDPSTNADQLRLKLDTITLVGSGSLATMSQVYKSFLYSQTTNLPVRSSPNFDYCGYYNTVGGYNTTSFSVPDINGTMADVLTSIQDIAGEKLQFQYELNKTLNYGTVPGLRIKQVSKTTSDGNNVFTQYTYVDSSGNTSGQFNAVGYTNAIFLARMLGCCSSTYACPTVFNQPQGSLCYSFTQVNVSESLYDTYDLNGAMVGYTYVNVLNQNGGYDTYKYTNFYDFPDVNLMYFGTNTSGYQMGSPTSYSYKRGLQLDKSTYRAGGVKISEIQNFYTDINQTPTKTAYGISPIPFYSAGNVTYTNYFQYNSVKENYLLNETIVTEYDQKNPANSIQSIINYTYSPADSRLVQTIQTTDSKGQSHSQTVYHPDDSNIPLSSPAEMTALSSLQTSNCQDIPITEVDSRNGTIHQIHNVYSASAAGLLNPVNISNSATYTGNTLELQRAFNYDPMTSHLLSTSMPSGKSTSTIFGYNSTYPIARAVNASNTVIYSNQALSQQGSLNIPANTWGAQTVSFTTYFPGTITIAMPPGSYLAGSVTCFFSFSLSGPSGGSGNLCENSKSGYTCSVGNSVTYTNMPAGNYTLSVSPQTNTATASVPVTYSYQGLQVVATPTTEFFFEGFEQNPSAISGAAHTGSMYLSSNYSVPYTPPNGRSYVVQWWNLSGGIWNFNEQPYTSNMTLTGPLDDVRVFPNDAQLTTYTYQPLVGVTSQTDPGGRTESYQYDGLGRLNIVRDNDGNIIKKYCYTYAGQPSTCLASGVVQCSLNSSYITWNFALTNIVTGQVTNYSLSAAANSGLVLGTIPSGNYNLAITPGNNSSHGLYFGNYYLSGSGTAAFSLTNIPIMSNIGIYISY